MVAVMVFVVCLMCHKPQSCFSSLFPLSIIEMVTQPYQSCVLVYIISKYFHQRFQQQYQKSALCTSNQGCFCSSDKQMHRNEGKKVDGSSLDLFAFITKPRSEDNPDRKAHVLTESPNKWAKWTIFRTYNQGDF